MLKFKLTRDDISGALYLVYNDAGIICVVDASESKLGVASMERLFAIVPRRIDVNNLIQSLAPLAEKFTIVEIPADLSFDRFWEVYNHKVNRKRCLPLYAKLEDSDKFLAIIKIKDYRAYLSRVQWRSAVDPERWLRDRMFETEWKKIRN